MMRIDQTPMSEKRFYLFGFSILLTQVIVSSLPEIKSNRSHVKLR